MYIYILKYFPNIYTKLSHEDNDLDIIHININIIKMRRIQISRSTNIRNMNQEIKNHSIILVSGRGARPETDKP